MKLHFSYLKMPLKSALFLLLFMQLGNLLFGSFNSQQINPEILGSHVLIEILSASSDSITQNSNRDHIRPHSANPYYWQYRCCNSSEIA